MNAKERFLREQYRWMMKAVSSKTHPDHRNYGQLGISIDERWLASFDAFADDVRPTLPSNIGQRRLLLKPQQRRFQADTIEWGFKSKFKGGIRKRQPSKPGAVGVVQKHVAG